ncbi:MAG: FAD-binding domain-containing protein [Pseudomonadota bacterium]
MSAPLNHQPQVVWFKRDLRLDDHAALVSAAERGPVLPLYCVEPDYWALPDTSRRHWQFLSAALTDLDDQIEQHGGKLCVQVGDICSALTTLRKTLGPFDLHAHMETGNDWTFQRDKAVRAWCRTHGIAFFEHAQFGVWRGSEANRDRWAKMWDRMMAEPIQPVPGGITWIEVETQPLPCADDLGLQSNGEQWIQPAGRDEAWETLHSFLSERGEPYQRAMSSPIAGTQACSRLSTHLSVGTLPMRETYQAALERQKEVASWPAPQRGDWPKALKSFLARLHWHCHFIQKLESEPELEYLPAARAYKDLRAGAYDQRKMDAFENGQTGYPFVDACMRSLRATGWINFRMRAMLMSFASHDLWLPWQQSGLVLARYFTDYEPGIHWPQCQMQSGETGINTVRVYSPIKQGYDQDPDGVFIKQWVPELAQLTGKDVHEPWRLTLMKPDYPDRIVDHAEAVARSKEAIFAIRKSKAAQAEARAVYQKHGSRKRPASVRFKDHAKANDQASLF